MKTFSEQYNDLFKQIENKLYQLIEWKGEKSNFVNEQCLKINSDTLNYDEIVYINGRITLLDQDGHHYNLSCLDFDTLCDLTDKLSHFNPKDNKDYPVRTLANRVIDLSEYPNFDKSGSVYGMKKLYYGKGALLVRDGGYIYDVTRTPEIYFEHAI